MCIALYKKLLSANNDSYLIGTVMQHYSVTGVQPANVEYEMRGFRQFDSLDSVFHI